MPSKPPPRSAKAPPALAPSGATIAVFGGSGFIGRHIVNALARAGYDVRVCVRRPNAALFLKTAGRVGQVTLTPTHISDAAAVAAALDGVDGVVNAVGILYERGAQKFTAIQAEGAARLAEAAAARGIKNFVHISAIGADSGSPSRYAQSKATGEAAVLQAIPSAHILRPSLVIGPEDDFFNRFARLAVLSPALPLIDGGTTRFQPIGVFDVARAVQQSLTAPPQAGIYELGGAEIFTFKQLMELLLAATKQRRLLLPLPRGVARIIAQFARVLPNPPLTPDQLLLLDSDNIVAPRARTLADFGITPAPIAGLLPAYLGRFAKKP